jgi:hypothetical protein
MRVLAALVTGDDVRKLVQKGPLAPADMAAMHGMDLDFAQDAHGEGARASAVADHEERAILARKRGSEPRLLLDMPDVRIAAAGVDEALLRGR